MMRVVFSLLFVLALVGAYCGYEIVASTTLYHEGASMVPGMRSALPR